MNAAHTPGPWFYLRGDEWSHSVVTNEGDLPDGSPSWWTVASINKNREPQHKANARLIAAAPDLLDALLMVLDDPDALDGRPRTAEYVRAAIAKATGASA